MIKPSLSAYAAWLAKHETKAPKRRSLEPVAAPDVVHGLTAVSPDESRGPYLQWIKQKETKQPLVKVVMATPAAIDAIVERGRAAAAIAQASKSRVALAKRMNGESSSKSTSLDTKPDERVDAAKGKKRTASELVEPEAPVGKKKKVVAFSSRDTDSHLRSSTITWSDAVDTDQKSSEMRPSSCHTNSRVKLPMLKEVRYWQDVDRFSFLA